MTDIMTTDEMIAELKANGYKYGVFNDLVGYSVISRALLFVIIHTPDSFIIRSDTYPAMEENSPLKARAIEKAYAHYQREKKHTAMESLVTKLSRAQVTIWDDDGIPAYDSDYQDLIDEAKAILGKE